MKRVSLSVLVLASVLLLSACLGKPQMKEDAESQVVSTERPEDVEVTLINQAGVEVGMALLKQEGKGVEINVEASHLPEGLHGFHVHETGICEAPGFESAGGHFNPNDKEHGFDNPKGPHKGDIHNLEVQSDGMVRQTFYNESITLKKGEANSLFGEEGTALVIHANPDDYVSQPAGNAGERIVCGVIVEKGRE